MPRKLTGAEADKPKRNPEADKRHTTIPERIDVPDISALPALITTDEAARIIGATPLAVAKACARGKYVAVKCGRNWRINKAKFLEAVKLA